MFINSGYSYLAAPYTAEQQAVKDWRVMQIRSAAAKLLREKIRIFSPIEHTYQMEKMLPPELALNHSFWLDLDAPMVAGATSLSILMLPGWEESAGVAEEREIARVCRIPEIFLPPPYKYGDYAKYFMQHVENRID